MSKQIPLKAETTLTNALYPDVTMTLPAGTPVDYRTLEFLAGTLHIITYGGGDGREVYQAFKFIQSVAAPEIIDLDESVIVDDAADQVADDDHAQRLEDLRQTYADAEAARPEFPATPEAPDDGRQLFLYTGKSGATARYSLVKYEGGWAIIKPADWTGDSFRVKRYNLRRLTPGVAEKVKTVDNVPAVHTRVAGRVRHTIFASDLGLAASVLSVKGWPNVLNTDVDGVSGKLEFRFDGFDRDQEGDVTAARYAGTGSDLIVYND